MMIRLQRVYEPADPSDGARVLVERLWPRGISKERAALKLWLKDVAPSPELRTWFGHDPEKWEEFRRRYWEELEHNPEPIEQLRELVEQGNVTFIYSAHDEEHNAAVVLKDYIERSKVAA
ncbi:MAG: DUF488 domain-containing protein [Armatimonadetes bacterium]|nr:DUF488 domain-containing protein [Armatimonadota bacterium]